MGQQYFIKWAVTSIKSMKIGDETFCLGSESFNESCIQDNEDNSGFK